MQRVIGKKKKKLLKSKKSSKEAHRKNWYEMQCDKPDHTMRLIDEVPNLQKDREIASEVPIRMNVVLPPCWVVLKHLTEEEIHRSYPDHCVNEDTTLNQSQELLNKTDSDYDYTQDAALEKEYRRQRKLRRLSRVQGVNFELYKRKRKHFIDRRSAISENSGNILRHSTESEADMSQDELKNPSSLGKSKKKIKRGKYERDSEWSPHSTPSTVQYGNRLRRQVRRPIIDSDSSSTDEDEILYNEYINGNLSGDSNSNNSAFQNPVPSEFDSNEPVASSSGVNKIPVEKDTLDNGNVSSPKNFQAASQNVTVHANAHPDTSHLDIVSGIIKEMDNCKRVTSSSKPSPSSTVSKTPARSNLNIKSQRGKKKRKLLDDSADKVNSVVACVVQEMVTTVCAQHKQQKVDKKKFSKKCVWCHTQFSTSKADETMCNICYDLGKGKYVSSTSNKNSTKPSKDKAVKGQKQVSGSKVKKVSGTMSRVLKNLPKNEMQRLMYTDKSVKLSNEKGYNHCKSISAAKGVQDTADVSRKSHESINTENVNKTGQVRLKYAKKTVVFGKKRTSTPLKSDSINNSKDHAECESVSERSGRSSTNSSKDRECGRIPPKRNKISLKKFNEGLFLMSFPEPDEELNICMEGESTSNSHTVQETDAENSCRLNGSRAAKPSNKSVTQPKKPKDFQSVAKDEDFKTFILPPVPTVLVANYSGRFEENENYHLSNIFYQNEYTLQNADTTPVKINGDSPNLPGLPSCSISIPNSSPNLLNNAALTIATIPLNNSINQIQPFTNNSTPLLITTAVPSSTITFLPVVSSVVSLSEQASHLNGNESLFFPANNNFVNSEQLQIKITHVSSENAFEKNSDVNSESVINNKIVDDEKTTMMSENSEASKFNEESLNEKNTSKISTKRKCSNYQKGLSSKKYKKSKIQKEKNSSCTDISEHSQEVLSMSENIAADIEAVNSIVQEINQNTAEIQDENLENANVVQNENSILPNSENDSKCAEQNLNASGQAGETSNNSAETQSIKPTEAVENSPPDPVNSAIDLVGAVAILGVIDLERNPPYRLSFQMERAKENLVKLTSEKNSFPVNPELNDKIALCRYNIKVFEIAQKYLNLYGSFAKVSEHLMRRHQIDHMIQIKRERMDEDEDEEDANQSSCRFPQRSQSATQFSNDNFSSPPEMPSPSPLAVKMENVGSCRLTEQAASDLNHLEKLQSQIAAMNNAQSHYDGRGGTIHHYSAEQYAAYTPAVAAPAPVMPRNDCMGGESRETPSRGSGPRTPARPESATSQPDEQSLALQVKKEQFETAVSSPSQCAYNQNATLTQISSQMPAMQELPILNSGGHTILNNTLQQISASGTVNQIYTSTQSNFNMQSRDVSISRAPPSYNSSKQSYTNLLLNMAGKPQASSNVIPGINTNMNQNGQLFGQQLCIPSGTGLPQKQVVPSVNNNQYIIQQNFPAPNNNGTVLVNSSQLGGQNVNALLTNVSNQQFYTTNQVSQVYYPPTSQVACTQNIMAAPNVTVSQIQQTTTETMDQMYCAVCNNLATLRCKQCAKVAYCDTACAKTYWHQKHKMECKPLPS